MMAIASEETTTFRFISRSEGETVFIGTCIGAALYPGLAVLLEGELGTGKTTLVRGIAESLGISGVRSPSFTIINEYEGRERVAHVDLFRLSADEVEMLGLEEYLDRGYILLVEWPIPVLREGLSEYWNVTIDFLPREGECARGISICACGERAREALKGACERLYKAMKR
ncbi:MAG TPA: tRNA (adenosine(37)-N6)-threonylcarbamoyltransferase complex ATPase subunit type 1 TsaE [Thermosynergistes sp.]|jgi:tRNA threonylcarbamoyladenosine biosynthesis protein TsaE|nr:tRNA (adenosine(37)-N6)-threonylcarbamoyltransferase complex ATPase subunit type 1 TsaE [Thermosynergistes sp.]